MMLKKAFWQIISKLKSNKPGIGFMPGKLDKNTLQHKNFPRTSSRYNIDRIVKFDRNQLFKGHSGTIGANAEGVYVFNTYFDGSIHHEYTTADNITRTTLSIILQTPSYIVNHMKFLNTKGIERVILKSNNFEFILFGYNIWGIFRYYYTDIGPAWSNHHDNIIEIKKCQKLYVRQFMYLLKTISSDILLSSGKIETQEDENTKVLVIHESLLI